MDIRSEFNHVALSDVGQEKAKKLREAFTTCLNTVEDTTDGSAEATLARRNLQQACYWALKALALSPMNQAVPLLLVLFALPAFAQEAVAQPQPQNALQWIIYLVGSVIVAPLVKGLFELLRAKTQNTTLQTAEGVLDASINGNLSWVQARLMEAANDGVVTRAELDAIGKDLLAKLSAKTMDTLQQHYGEGLLGVVVGIMRGKLTAMLSVSSAAAAAVLTVDTTPEAMAARRARATGLVP